MKEFRFYHNGIRTLFTKCIGRAVKEILSEYPELRNKSIQDINLQIVE